MSAQARLAGRQRLRLPPRGASTVASPMHPIGTVTSCTNTSTSTSTSTSVTSAATGTYPSAWRPVFRRLVQRCSSASVRQRPHRPQPPSLSASSSASISAANHHTLSSPPSAPSSLAPSYITAARPRQPSPASFSFSSTSSITSRRAFLCSASLPTRPPTRAQPSARARLFPSPSTSSASITLTMGADQKRAHGGHSHGHGHGHHHHHDNTYLTSSNKNDAGVRITRIGLFSNLGMAFAKGAGGYAFGSQALIADAWHSLTDLASDVLTLATVSWSLRPPTDAFPAGFGKVESLGSLGVSSMLLGGGLFMFWSSLLSLHAHFFLDPAAAADAIAHMHHGHGHGGHSHGHVGPSLHAAWLAAGTVAIKEWLYHATMKVARERKSSVLASNAVHHRVDSLTGVVTLAVVLGANVIENAAWLDPVGGLFISLLVVKAGAENTRGALYELADRSIDDEVAASVRKHAARGIEARGAGAWRQVEVRDVSGVKSGQNYLVDVELAVPGDWTVEEARAVEAAVRGEVGARVRGVRRVRVRYVPSEAPVADKFDEYIPGDVSQRSSPEPEDEDDGHGHANGHANGNGHVHGNGNGHSHEKQQ